MQDTRCFWVGKIPEFVPYHDTEWGFPVADDQRLFEKICLESFQSGLSWRTILNKRPAFRSAFEDFDFTKVAHYGEEKIASLLQDASIIRHRGKIEAAINNAKRACEVVEHQGSLAAFIWRYEPSASERPSKMTEEVVRSLTQTPASKRLAKDLKSGGWKFVGPTTAYAFMQSMGLVNDHVEGCICREPVRLARKAFVRPTA